MDKFEIVLNLFKAGSISMEEARILLDKTLPKEEAAKVDRKSLEDFIKDLPNKGTSPLEGPWTYPGLMPPFNPGDKTGPDWTYRPDQLPSYFDPLTKQCLDTK